MVLNIIGGAALIFSLILISLLYVSPAAATRGAPEPLGLSDPSFGIASPAPWASLRSVDGIWGPQELWDTPAAEFRALGNVAITSAFSAAVPAADELLANGNSARDRNGRERPVGIDFGLNLPLGSFALDKLALVVAANHSWRDIHSGVPNQLTTADFDVVAETAIFAEFVVNASIGLSTMIDPGAAREDPTRSAFSRNMKASVGLAYELAPGLTVGAEAVRFTGLEWADGGKRWALQAGPNVKYSAGAWTVAIASLPRWAGAREVVVANQHQNLSSLERNRVLGSATIVCHF